MPHFEITSLVKEKKVSGLKSLCTEKKIERALNALYLKIVDIFEPMCRSRQ